MSLKERADKVLRGVAIAGLVAGCARPVEQKPNPTKIPATEPPKVIPATETPTPTLTPDLSGMGGGVYTPAEATAIAQALNQEEVQRKIKELEEFSKKKVVIDIGAYTVPETNKVSTSIVYRADEPGSEIVTIYTWNKDGDIVEIKGEEGEDFKPDFDAEGNPRTYLVNEQNLVIGYVYEDILVRKTPPFQPKSLPFLLPEEYFQPPTPTPTPTETLTPTPEFAIIPEIKDYDFFWGYKRGEYGLVLGDLLAGGDQYFAYYLQQNKDGSVIGSFYLFRVVSAGDGSYSQKIQKQGVQIVEISPKEEDGNVKIDVSLLAYVSHGYKDTKELSLVNEGRGKEVVKAIKQLWLSVTGRQRSDERIIRDLKEAQVNYSSLP